MKLMKDPEVKYSFMMVIMSLITIIMMTTLPWFTDHTTYPDGEEAFFLDGEIVVVGAGDDTSVDEVEAMGTALLLLNVTVLLTAIFSLIGLFGIVVHRCGYKATVAKLCILAPVFAILSIIFIVMFISAVGEFNDLAGGDHEYWKDEYSPNFLGLLTIAPIIAMIPLGYMQFKVVQQMEKRRRPIADMGRTMDTREPPRGARPPPSETEKMEMDCPGCGSLIVIEDIDQAQRVVCGKCDSAFDFDPGIL